MKAGAMTEAELEAEPTPPEPDPTPEETMARLQSEDTRPRVPLSKEVNLAQLSDEMGVGLCASDAEVVVADPDADITKAQLAAAVKAHVPDPNFGRDPDDVRREELAEKAKAGTLTGSERDELLGLVAARA
jgi:hypothetical protein